MSDPEGFSFDPDLSRAATLPARLYYGEAPLERERARVFARTWQLVGRASQVAEAGDYFTGEVAGEPLVVVRGSDDVVRALSAVCRHRAGPVAEGEGRRCKAFRCAYHGWTYSLEGGLIGAPELQGLRDFDAERVALPAFRVATWAGFVFVNLWTDAPSLGDVIGGLADETRHLPLERMTPYRSVDYEVPCNWKAYVDNYLEGYHIPLVHPRLFRELDYTAYRVETATWHSRQHAPLRRAAGAVYGEGGASDQAFYYWLYPNLMLNLYPDNVQLNVVVPLAPERTLTRFVWCLLEPDAPGATERFERAFAFAEEVQREDTRICERVQRGLRAPSYDRGRYSVNRENGVHHFHGLLARFLAE